MSRSGEDWSRWINNQRQNITAETCAALRLRLVETTDEIQAIADEEFPNHSRSALSYHAHGNCKHDVDVPPVERGWLWKGDE
jgi:hypothetical protein